MLNHQSTFFSLFAFFYDLVVPFNKIFRLEYRFNQCTIAQIEMNCHLLNYRNGIVILLCWIITLSLGYRLHITHFPCFTTQHFHVSKNRKTLNYELSMSTTVAPIYGESDSERLKKAKLRLAEAQVKQ